MRSAPKIACLVLFHGVLLAASSARGETALDQLWSQFQQTRRTAPGLHQEFEVTRKFKTGHGDQALVRRLKVDISQDKWREESTSGSDDRIRVFDGANLFLTESGEPEYMRLKPKAEKGGLLPEPYGTIKIEWHKAKQITRLPCGFSGKDHTCVVIEAPVKVWSFQTRADQMTRMADGTSRVMIDTESGIWLQCHAVELIEGPQISYQMELTYALKNLSYDAAPEPATFKLPDSATHEVKKLTPWDAARIKKQLVGRPAPELQVTDIQGNLISLSDLKGKTVLLDFWTTWCPPCQADSQSIEKLYQKYGARDLRIVGISVSEERETVENYLKKHPHSFPVVLTSENVLPRPYQIGVFPTYLIIGPDGTLSSAEEGDQGFGHLRKTLEKAGMAID